MPLVESTTARMESRAVVEAVGAEAVIAEAVDAEVVSTGAGSVEAVSAGDPPPSRRSMRRMMLMKVSLEQQ